MKRTAVIVILSLLAAFVFSACAPAAPSGQTPEFLNDIGKTLIELKNEHPEGEIIESLDFIPRLCRYMLWGAGGGICLLLFRNAERRF